MEIRDQIVLITGGARGVGAAAARAFAGQGARVAINWRNSGERAEALAADLGERALAVQADVTDRAGVDAMVAEVQAHFGGPVSTVVNNALDYSFNGDARAQMTDIPWEDMERQFATVIRGALNVIQATAPGMGAQKFGRVINIGTNLFQNPVVPYHDYTAAKAALLSLTRTAAGDLGPSGITVNMISGGLLRTTDASAATPEAVFDLIASMTPLRSVTTPEEFADAALFFASPWSRAVTGQNLVVDGGLVRD
ncbi:3-oxoacyl-ACP reductase [Brevundimonas naejangsanensis]|uniref:3-oxoacyl-ACP reductase n=1 Tax=Brevundimonas naejangsanensis TaxID=588932 RepID=UPI0026F12928|nr:3-oxoacyl-ACP reductase [Brevundimonas naejangsanensis]